MEISQIHTCTPRPGAPPAPRAPNQTRQLPANQVPPQQLRKAGADDEVIVYKGNVIMVLSWRVKKNALTLTISACCSSLERLLKKHRDLVKHRRSD